MKTTITRRDFLGTGLAAGGLLALPGLARAGVSPATPSRRLRLYNTHTAEMLDVTYFENGEYHPQALAELDFILRDFRANEAMPMARGVLDLVHDLSVALETDAPVHIISGYRSPATNAMLRETRDGGVAKHSLHMDGMAIDLRVPGRSLAQVHNAALKLHRGGVGFYTKEDFVHVDVGRIRRWG